MLLVISSCSGKMCLVSIYLRLIKMRVKVRHLFEFLNYDSLSLSTVERSWAYSYLKRKAKLCSPRLTLSAVLAVSSTILANTISVHTQSKCVTILLFFALLSRSFREKNKKGTNIISTANERTNAAKIERLKGKLIHTSEKKACSFLVFPKLKLNKYHA